MNKNATYVNSKRTNRICIPLPIQAAYIRLYCKNTGFVMPLPSNEVGLLGNYPVLFSLLHSDYENIFFTSHLLIPDNYRVSCNDKSETKLHFILEKTIITVREMNAFIIERDLINCLSKSDYHFVGLD